MQAPLGTGRRHIQQATVLEPTHFRLQPLDPGRGARLLTAMRGLHRSEQQLGVTVVTYDFLPIQQLAPITLRRLTQPGQDYRVEFEALGLVNGHQLQARITARVGQREQSAHAVANVLGGRWFCAAVEVLQ